MLTVHRPCFMLQFMKARYSWCLNGKEQFCKGTGVVHLRLDSSASVNVDMLFAD